MFSDHGTLGLSSTHMLDTLMQTIHLIHTKDNCRVVFKFMSFWAR